MDVHLRDLRYFVAVAEELSFTRAARRLHLSQPALSKQIQGLETALHAQLLQRNRREVKLTEAGEALLASARSLLESWDGTTATVTEAAARDTRVLRVGTLTSIGRALYPGVIDQFAVRQPGWRVELRSFGWGDPTAGLRDRVTDVAFLWLPIDADDIAHEILVTERRVLALSTKHPLAGRSAVTFADIVDEPLLALRNAPVHFGTSGSPTTNEPASRPRSPPRSRRPMRPTRSSPPAQRRTSWPKATPSSTPGRASRGSPSMVSTQPISRSHGAGTTNVLR